MAMLLGHGLSKYVRSSCKHPKLTNKQVINYGSDL